MNKLSENCIPSVFISIVSEKGLKTWEYNETQQNINIVSIFIKAKIYREA
ncbi:MAG TPA: hypothetical protein VGK25_11830 [Ignavibacteria bacterium]